MSLGVGGIAAGDRLIHNTTQGARATPTLCAAAETIIDFSGAARTLLAVEGCTDFVVAQHVAGTNDHGRYRRDWSYM
jgi:hypothetical protein